MNLFSVVASVILILIVIVIVIVATSIVPFDSEPCKIPRRRNLLATRLPFS